LADLEPSCTPTDGAVALDRNRVEAAVVENDVEALAAIFVNAAADEAAIFATANADATDDAILSCLQCRVRWIAIVRFCGQET